MNQVTRPYEHEFGNNAYTIFTIVKRRKGLYTMAQWVFSQKIDENGYTQVQTKCFIFANHKAH